MHLTDIVTGALFLLLGQAAHAACEVVVTPGSVDVGWITVSALQDVPEMEGKGFKELHGGAVALRGSCRPALGAGVPLKISMEVPAGVTVGSARPVAGASDFGQLWLNAYEPLANGVPARFSLPAQGLIGVARANVRASQVIELISAAPIGTFELKFQTRVLLPKRFLPTSASRIEGDVSISIVN